jgi:hypothetical protein
LKNILVKMYKCKEKIMIEHIDIRLGKRIE